VGVYIDALEKIVANKHLTVYIHPIIPVLDVTRPMVKNFTATLQKRLQGHKKLIYLDFFDK
jgi:hypothetical protein